ncbi:MAG: hypothetical protein PHD05_03150 [Sphaerochaetaceae bacterium]|jgi:hypothetical protein|nr:hypothetical protein [Sphaerochaetaceae bacterium]
MKELINKFSTLIILIFLVGFTTGLIVNEIIHTHKMDNIVILGAFIHKSQVYEVIPKELK